MRGMGWLGLVMEVQAICKEIGLPDATDNEENIAKDAVKEAIALHHLTYLKSEMKGKKLEAMAQTDMRRRRDYTLYGVEDCRMAFRLETFQFDCRANMPTRYGRDLVCRACSPKPASGQEKEHEREKEQEEQIESQEHLESCSGYSELWQGLGAMSPLSRCRYFIRVKQKRLQQRY